MASPTPGKTQLGIDSNLAGLLCYAPCCLGFVVSIVALIVEKQSRFLKFHAFQSLLLHGAAFLVWVGFMVAGMVLSAVSGVLGMVLFPVQIVVGVGFLALTVLMMVKAYNNEEYALPTVGEMARKWASQ